MARLSILHETRYSYARPVGFGAHRLLIRPRDSHAIRIVEASLRPLCPARPAGPTTRPATASAGSRRRARPTSLIDHQPPGHRPLSRALTSLQIDDPHTISPIVYSREDRAVLNPFITPATDDDDRVLLRWLRQQMERPDEPAIDFLLRMNATIHDSFVYKASPGSRHPDSGRDHRVGGGHLPRLRLADGRGPAAAGVRGGLRHRLHLQRSRLRPARRRRDPRLVRGVPARPGLDRVRLRPTAWRSRRT